LLHATVLALGNRTDPVSELQVSETVMRSLEATDSAKAGQPDAGDLALILTIRGRALIASGDSVKALECYRKALSGSTALLARSARNPVAGFVLASVLLDFSAAFPFEPIGDAFEEYRKYVDAASRYSAVDPVNAEAKGVLYARLSDMAEILTNRQDKGAAEFHRMAAEVAGDLGTQLAQGSPVSTEWGARQRFYHFRESDPASDAGLLGLRYSVLQLVRGAWQEVDPTKEFHAGDLIRLRMESNTDGYFYVANRGTSGNWRVFYPQPGQPNTVWSQQPTFLLSGISMEFDHSPGTERLHVVFSKTPRKEWGAAAGPPANSIAPEDLVQLLQQYDTKPQYEMVGKETSVSAPASREHALYVAQPASEAGRPLIFDIRLKHGP
jgi:hypothetical protein